MPRIGFAYILAPGKLFADSLFFSADEITEQRRKLLRAALDTVQAMRSIDTTQSIIECDAVDRLGDRTESVRSVSAALPCVQWLLTSDGTKSAATIGDNQATLQKNGVLQVHCGTVALSPSQRRPVTAPLVCGCCGYVCSLRWRTIND